MHTCVARNIMHTHVRNVLLQRPPVLPLPPWEAHGLGLPLPFPGMGSQRDVMAWAHMSGEDCPSVAGGEARAHCDAWQCRPPPRQVFRYALRVCALKFRSWLFSLGLGLCGKYQSSICLLSEVSVCLLSVKPVSARVESFNHTCIQPPPHTQTHTDNLSDEEVEGIDIPQCTPLVYTLRRTDLRYPSTLGVFCQVRSL
jgi:hypothetical protein